MSKPVKSLITDHLKGRWQDVNDALLIDLSALEANKNMKLRKHLRERDIQVMVIKNSLGRRASEGTPLAPAFEGLGGTTAVVWGAEDVVSLAKEVTALASSSDYKELATKGGVMDGTQLSADEVKQVSKWPSRTEQLSILMGQVLSPAATLSGQLLAPARNLASQIKQKSEGDEEE